MSTKVHYVRRLYESIGLKGSSDGQSLRLIKGASGIFLLRILYTGITFITGILLARVLGTFGFGTYNYALTWTITLGIAANVGFDNLLVREVATYSAQSAWGLVRGILRYANQVVFFLSSMIAIGAIALAWHTNSAESSQTFSAFCVAMISLPIVALRNLTRGAIKGFNHVVLGLLPELLIAPIILIVLVGGFYLLLPQQLNATWTLGLYLASALITLAIAIVTLNRVMPAEAQSVKREYQIRRWVSSALPFVFLEGLYALNAQVDVLMLGAIRGVEAAGIYVPVNRGANLIAFGVMAVVSALAPVQTNLFVEGKRKELQELMTKGIRGVLFASVAIALPLILFGHWYLMLFGSAFTQGQTALTILCIGQVIASVTGLAGPLLNMTGFERCTLISVLNALLIPKWGVDGAAIATSVSIALGNVMNVIWANRKLGIHSRIW
jgi:O-antigen/teichoic acid export membrane protein